MAPITLWRRGHRSYCAALYTDLFGTLLVAQCWSSTACQIGGMKVTPVDSEAQGNDLLRRIAQRRRHHKYAMVSS